MATADRSAPRYSSVTQPSDARLHVLDVLVERAARGLVAAALSTRLALRQLGSATRARRCVFSSASIVIVSPSFTSAIGPPSCASGVTWPTMKPCEPPENRPSVMQRDVLAAARRP